MNNWCNLFVMTVNVLLTSPIWSKKDVKFHSIVCGEIASVCNVVTQTVHIGEIGVIYNKHGKKIQYYNLEW